MVTSPRRRRALTRTGGTLVLVAGLALAPLSTGFAAAAPGDVVDSGPGWTVTETADGFLVTLDLTAPLPFRSAQVGLEVDGVELGPVDVAPDGRSVQATTADPAVRDTDSVVLTWDGKPDLQAADGEVGDTAARPALDVLAQDPATLGAYTVARADYDLGDEVEPLAGIAGRRGEIRGAVYYPAERTTAAPVAVFLHGRHQPCDVLGDEEIQQWPCQGGGPIPSYLGYDAPARVLASNGVVVVSISADAVNALDDLSTDGGLQARGQLVLDTLTRLAAADRGDSPGFDPVLQGRLDLTNVGLMGHSRGGVGVIRAARLNAALPEPFGIRAVLPLAPTNTNREVAPGAVTAVVLPYCDGDVTGLDGQHFVDDARGAFDDDVLRTAVTVMGANHNYFNTVWSPGGYPFGTSDDWANVDRDQSNPVCGQSAPTRLDQATQRAVGTAYLAGFFRLTLNDEQQFLPMFDGSGATAASVGDVDIRVDAQAPAKDRIDLAPPGVAAVTATGLRAVTCTGTDTAVIAGRAACSALEPDQLPHWNPAAFADTVPTLTTLNLAWTAAGATADIAVADGRRDVSAMTDLTVSLAAGDTVVDGTQVAVEVYDGAGTVATVDTTAVDAATRVLPGTLAPLRRVLLQQVTVPLTSLTGLDLTDLRGIRITSRTATGGLYVADIAATRSAPGTPSVRALPNLRVARTGLRQPGTAGSGQVAVVLDTPADKDVTAWVRARVLGGLRVLSASSYPVTVPAGSRCAPVVLPLPGADSGSFVSDVEVAPFLVTRGLTDSPEVGLTVQPAGDDTSGPQVGQPGDVCDEALADPGVLAVPTGELRPGDGFTVTGAGFRAGETVTLDLPGAQEQVTALADADGTVRIDAVVPAGAPAGVTDLTATGFGSFRTAVGSITVTTAPPTSTSPTTDVPPTSTDPTSATQTGDPSTSATQATSTVPSTDTPTVTVAETTVTAVVVPVVRTSSRSTTQAIRSDPLAHTGVDVVGLAAAGVLLVGGGLTVVTVSRRSRGRAH